MTAKRDPVPDDRARTRARLHDVGRQAHDLEVAVVADDEAEVLVEHGEPLRHVGERRVEAAVLGAELVFLPLQRFEVELALADVLVRGDEAAIRSGSCETATVRPSLSRRV